MHNPSYAAGGCYVYGSINVGSLGPIEFPVPPFVVSAISNNTPTITPISDWYTTSFIALANCKINESIAFSSAQPSDTTYNDNGTSYNVYDLPNTNIGYIASAQWTGANKTFAFPIPISNGSCFDWNRPCDWTVQKTLTLTIKIRFIRKSPLSSGIISLPTTATYIAGWASKDGNGRGFLRLSPTSVIVQTRSCTVNTSNIQVQLPSIQTAHLPSPGSTTGATPFNVSISCPSPVNAYMTITDNSNPTQTSNIIQAASGSTTSGIGVQIQQNGQTIYMGPDSSMAGNLNQFLVGSNVIGTRSFPFSASYIRTSAANVGAGTLTARATFTMSYQ